MAIFADSAETSAWEEHLRSLSAPDRPVALPEADELREVLRSLDIPEEDIGDVIALAPILKGSTELWWYLERAVWSLAAHMGCIDSPPRIAPLRDINDPTYRYFYVLVYVAALPDVRDYHRRLGIPDDISQSTLADVGRNVRVHRKREGIGGLGVAWWLMLHFRGMIYQLGRLQFELSRLGPAIARNMNECGLAVHEGTPALSIHIPDFCGPMSPELCDEAIARAREFFLTYFPNTPYDYAICNSWLLDPALKAHLRPESNIVRFQDRFQLADAGWDSTEGIMQFVFGSKLSDMARIEPRTSLEHAVVRHIHEGGTWYGYGGWFPLGGPDVAARPAAGLRQGVQR